MTAIDLTQMQMSPHGRDTVMVITSVFSKWAMAVPIICSGTFRQRLEFLRTQAAARIAANNKYHDDTTNNHGQRFHIRDKVLLRQHPLGCDKPDIMAACIPLWQHQSSQKRTSCMT
ncbi:hypothetical protein PoB_007697000 [Plakobranchus ocellatus]|uniref:Uncharacterized protein n=1 Tax=Plakobranchus ocellatus TaxID=259542 RepID=A0AAV4E2H3_9GAST|nr:hypothetical protein PoB_007697000 [Plakobranchus ocellatus]